jgi:hypothetical protein
MRAADREPAGGEIPVELVCRQPPDDFPIAGRGVEDKWACFEYRPGSMTVLLKQERLCFANLND